MPALQGYDCEGTLTIGGISMNCPAWSVQGDDTGQGSLVRLWSWFEVRGEDRLVPGFNGVIPRRRRLAPTRHDLRLIVTGDVDQDGIANADTVIGMEDNLTYLVYNVVEPVASSTGTRAATLTTPAGGFWSADIHVLGFDLQGYYIDPNKSSIAEVRLMISIPAGRFE